MGNVTIRTAQTDDVEGLPEAYEWLFAPPGSRPADWDRATAVERLHGVINNAERSAIFVATDETGSLVGFCCVYRDIDSVRFGPRAWIEDLAVDPDGRSQGVGKRLLDAARGWARERGAVHLELDSGDGRGDAHRFYRREQPLWESRQFGFSVQMVGADRVAAAFGLSPSGATLEPLRHGDLPTWTLITTEGRYVLKALAATTEGFRRPCVERAMILERYASEAGIRTPEPLPPTEPDVGWCTKINGHGWFRAHAWVDHRPLSSDDEIAPWLGRTLATLHRLMPVAAEPDWPSIGIHDSATWAAWVDAADRAGRPWAELARSRLPFIAELTDRLRTQYASAPDWVVTHADLDRHNALITPDGPVLIDWDTVWPYSAALQAGQVALLFGRDRPDRIRAILDAYRDSGGRLDWAGGDLFVSAAAHRLAALGIRIQVLLGQRPAPRWLDLGTADQQVDDQLRRLPGLVDELDDRARLVTH